MRLMGKANWWSPKWLDNLFGSTKQKPKEKSEE
jgi:hypothetical protein